MATLHTKINTRSPEFAISISVKTQVDDLRALLNKTRGGVKQHKSAISHVANYWFATVLCLAGYRLSIFRGVTISGL